MHTCTKIKLKQFYSTKWPFYTSVAFTLLLTQCIPCWRQSLYDASLFLSLACEKQSMKPFAVIFSTYTSYIPITSSSSMFVGNQLQTAKKKRTQAINACNKLRSTTTCCQLTNRCATEIILKVSYSLGNKQNILISNTPTYLSSKHYETYSLMFSPTIKFQKNNCILLLQGKIWRKGRAELIMDRGS